MERRRPDAAVHAEALPANGATGGALCGIRKVTTVTGNWREVTCMPCLCEMVDVIRAKVERVMDGPWSGDGRRKLAVKRKLPREQLKGDWDE